MTRLACLSFGLSVAVACLALDAAQGGAPAFALGYAAGSCGLAAAGTALLGCGACLTETGEGERQGAAGGGRHAVILSRRSRRRALIDPETLS